MTVYDADDPRLAQAAEESGLAEEYVGDPVLLRLLMVRLLKWGWAGQKTPIEAQYITAARKALGLRPPGGLKPKESAQARSTEKCSQRGSAPKQGVWDVTNSADGPSLVPDFEGD